MDNKGSMTVESCISFTLFIVVFLMLLTMVKFVMIEYILTYSANESAKSVADISYFVNVINTIQQDMDEQVDSHAESTMNFAEKKITKDLPTIVNAFIGYEISTGETNDSQKKSSAEAKKTTKLAQTGLNMYVDILKQIGTDFYGQFRGSVDEIKGSLKNTYVRGVIEKTLNEKGIYLEKEKLVLEVVKFPETTREYNLNALNIGYLSNGLVFNKDFKNNDAVVVISYKTKFKLPFFPAIELRFSKTAIEQCWINGGNGIVTKYEGDGLLSKVCDEIINFATTKDVYIANNGNKYHSLNCSKLADVQKNKVKETDAIDNGYKACSLCKP